MVTWKHCRRITHRLTDLRFIVCVRMCVHACVYTHACAYMCKHICIYVHVCITCVIKSEVYLYNTSRKKKIVTEKISARVHPHFTGKPLSGNKQVP